MSRPDMPQGTEREGGRGKGEGAQPLPTRVARVLRRIIGAPDYEAYVEHCALLLSGNLRHQRLGVASDPLRWREFPAPPMAFTAPAVEPTPPGRPSDTETASATDGLAPEVR